MSNLSDSRRDIDRALWFGLSRGVAGVFTLVLLSGAISIGLWAFGVFTSDIKGRGDAEKEKNRALNRIFQQAQFQSQYETIQGYTVQIRIAVAAVKDASPDTRPARETELVGLRQICVDTVNDYNARAKQFLAKQFRDTDLPERMDSTICEEGRKS